MLAKIVYEDREYYSHIFAIFNPGWFECVIVFDNENQKFELLNVYDTKPFLKRKVFIIDTDNTNMVEKNIIKISTNTIYKDCFGYSWILDNCDLISQIKDGKNIDEKYIKIAIELNNNINTSEWKYVLNQKDADDLLSAAWGFHDAKLKSISYKAEKYYNDPSSIQVLFTGCWDCDILLEFKKDVLAHFNINDSISEEISDSSILFQDGFVYWIDDRIDNINDITEECTYFKARSLAWKMLTKEMKDN